MKHYVQKHINNPEAFKIEQRSQPDHNTVCECSPQDDLDVMDLVDDVNELTQEVQGKKLQFSQIKYDAKQLQLAEAVAIWDAEWQRQADLEFLASTDWYVVRAMETGVAIPVEVTALRAEARLRLS